MNAVEIETAITDLAAQPFDREEFPYAFLQAFGNKETTLKRLRSGETNKSDLGGILQSKNIHILVTSQEKVHAGLDSLRASTTTLRAKAKFILATDGIDFEAEDLETGETVACTYFDFPNHFGFFLPLAGITTVKQIRESSFDIRATSRLNRLYLELLKHNPEWEKAELRHEMNHFMARLIFCFFAEDTDIFQEDDLFTATVERMSNSDSSNTHEVISEIFRAMNVKVEERNTSGLPRWANVFPYVNGGLFSGSAEVPIFSKIARTYLLHVGKLDWTQINPDIFGSMIQAVADDEERGALGMHYTSVPNILKVLNPLFLDDLREQLNAAVDNSRILLNLRKRISRIRVFDPACGSGNFLVIAYKQMRDIENEINKQRKESGRKSDIPLTNFRGIELRDFPAEIARLALIIAEYQCNVLYLGQQEALADLLPLDSESWITCGNALRLDWLGICPPTGKEAIEYTGDLFEPAQQQIDFENEGGETYICGNPPYKGRNKKGVEEKDEAEEVFAKYPGSFASLDYVANWIIKSAEYCNLTKASIGLVATNSVCQGEQVSLLWPLIFKKGLIISFAYTSFKWSNLASDKAGVTVVIIGLASESHKERFLYSGDEAKKVTIIGPYLVPNSTIAIAKKEAPISEIVPMYLGNMAKDGGNLIMHYEDARDLIEKKGVHHSYIRKFFGSEELIHSKPRFCLWIEESQVEDALKNAAIADIAYKVRMFRVSSKAPSTRAFSSVPYRFLQLSAVNGERAIIVPRVSSENRPYLPVDYFASGPIIGDKCYAIYDAPLWHFALIASRLHWVWIGTVCSRLRTDFSYGNKLGWNTFPVPTLTEKNKADLTHCAEDILLAREAHFPATIADLYDPKNMPADLKAAHDRNDEVLERIYIGRRFRNDTERLEKLFELYTKMTSSTQAKPAAKAKGKKV